MKVYKMEIYIANGSEYKINFFSLLLKCSEGTNYIYKQFNDFDYFRIL